MFKLITNYYCNHVTRIFFQIYTLPETIRRSMCGFICVCVHIYLHIHTLYMCIAISHFYQSRVLSRLLIFASILFPSYPFIYYMYEEQDSVLYIHIQYLGLKDNFIHLWNILCQLFSCCISISWWRHQMETFCTLLAICAGNSPVTGEFPAQRPVTRSFDVFFDLFPNKRLSKQWWGWWFETPSRPLWRHCDVIDILGWLIARIVMPVIPRIYVHFLLLEIKDF